MEIKNKLTTPPSAIHDIMYFYNIVEGINRKGGRVQIDEKIFNYLAQMINNYNESKATKYGFSFRPRGVNTETVKKAVSELVDLELIRRESGYLTLTNLGNEIAALIKSKESEQLKIIFARLMLDKYDIFEYLLKRIHEISHGQEFPIPFITAPVFERFAANSEEIVEKYFEAIRKSYPSFPGNLPALLESVREAKIELLEKKTEKTNKLQALVERFVVSAAFGPNIESRRAFDFIRSRTTFLEFTNYAIISLDGLPVDITYLTSDFEATFKQSVKKVDYSRGTLYVNHPAFEEVGEQFRELLTKFYISKKDEFGYVRIAEARDVICRQLRVSDVLFDTYLRSLYKKEPHLLSFTYLGAGEKITEKSLPLVMKEPMREFFTLLKINVKA